MDWSPFLVETAGNNGEDAGDDDLVAQGLYGGAITMCYPRTYVDVSDFRAVPDHQEVWCEAGHGGCEGNSCAEDAGIDSDDSVILELLNLKGDVPTVSCAEWFFRDLAEASGAARCEVEHSAQISVADICPEIARSLPATEVGCAVGWHEVAKFRDEEKGGAKARNKVAVYLCNLRLRDVGTDMLVTMYRTVEVGSMSSSMIRSKSSNSSAAAHEGDEDNLSAESMARDGSSRHNDNKNPGLTQFVRMLRTLTIHDMGLFG